MPAFLTRKKGTFCCQKAPFCLFPACFSNAVAKIQWRHNNSNEEGSTHCLKITQNVAFEFWHFPPIFVLLKLTCLVTLFDRKLQVFKNSPKWTIFGIFN